MAAHQAPPSLGLSRQEHWSGLPFPPPMHENETWKWSCPVVSDSSRPHGLQPTRLLHPWDFPGKSTGVGCHFLLQRIFPTQGSNPGLPHYRQTLYCLSHQGSIYYIVKYNILIILIFNVQKLLHQVYSHGEGNGTSLQYSCLENPMDGGAW